MTQQPQNETFLSFKVQDVYLAHQNTKSWKSSMHMHIIQP
jgi:hypothetical protein